MVQILELQWIGSYANYELNGSVLTINSVAKKLLEFSPKVKFKLVAIQILE